MVIVDDMTYVYILQNDKVWVEVVANEYVWLQIDILYDTYNYEFVDG